MSTLKPVTTSVPAAPEQPANQPPVKTRIARQIIAKKTVVKKAVVKKSVVKKPLPAKPASKQPGATKAPDSRAAVKKLTVKKPLSQVFATAQLESAVQTSKAVKLEKARKPKLVRDSFTIPKVEYVVLEALKQRATRLKRSVKKSELLRAGIKALAAMHDTAFLTALELVPAIKTGRPASEK